MIVTAGIGTIGLTVTVTDAYGEATVLALSATVSEAQKLDPEADALADSDESTTETQVGHDGDGTTGNVTIALDGSDTEAVSYTHLRAHETLRFLVCRLLLEKKKKNIY